MSKDNEGYLLIHHHQRRRVQPKHVTRRHQRLVQPIEQLEAGVLDQLFIIEDAVIVDL